jgi:hypothetical protein
MVEELYDIEVQLEPDATFEAARRMVDLALPGSASLRDRLAEHDRRTRLPADRAVAAVTELAARLRARTRAQLWLPEAESLTVEAASAVPWEADGRYLGGGRSLIRINVDRPLGLATAVEIAAHDGYPGHHAEASVKEELLIAAGHAELALIVRGTPQTLISEGMAGIGRVVVMGDQELAHELLKLATSFDLD